MKFKTKFGLGEIVYYSRTGHGQAMHDEFLEVVAICFDIDKVVTYHCRFPKGLTVAFREKELRGDPDFNQEAGEYPYMIEGDEDIE